VLLVRLTAYCLWVLHFAALLRSGFGFSAEPLVRAASPRRFASRLHVLFALAQIPDGHSPGSQNLNLRFSGSVFRVSESQQNLYFQRFEEMLFTRLPCSRKPFRFRFWSRVGDPIQNLTNDQLEGA
jgi:hypothetical protein